MLSVIMLSIHFIHCHAECRYAEYRGAFANNVQMEHLILLHFLGKALSKF